MYIHSEHTKKIHLLVTEALLFVDVGNLAWSEKMRNLALLNSILLPQFLTEAFVLDGKKSAAELIKIFASKISECGSEVAANT